MREEGTFVNPKIVIYLLSLSALLFAKATGAVGATERPNILIVLGDDIDRDDLSPWGGPAHTPNLAQLAREGMRFDNVYANVAMCAPFRQELYSGRSAWRTRAMPNHSQSVLGTQSLPHYLRPLGYQVGLLGKRHVGPPEAYPFDKVGDLPRKTDANPLAVKRARRYMTQARAAGKPFCLVIAAHDAHGPYTNGDTSRYPPAEFKLPDDSIDTSIYRKNLSRHFAEITHLDDLLGQLRALLSEEKLASNTLILFCSEQGNAFPYSKWTCFNDGLASGVVAVLPAVIPAGTHSSQLMWISDIAPTLVRAAGGKVVSQKFDGRSQWKNFTGGHQVIHKYAYGAFVNCRILDNQDRVYPIRSIRDTRYSCIWSPRHDEEVTSNTTLTQALHWKRATEQPTGFPTVAGSWLLKSWNSKSEKHRILIERLHRRPEWALYDRHNDPEELNNQSENPQLAPVLKRLQQELKSWLKKWGDSDPVATEKAFRSKL